MAKSKNDRKEQKGKTREEIFEEIKKLSEKANQAGGQQLPLLPDLPKEDISGFDLSMLNDTADPGKSHRLYYGMRRLMMDNLPTGKENNDLRQFVYKEKNLFLNRGKELDKNGIRGSDGRMTFITFLEIAFQITVEWIKQGANATMLWQMFYDENDKFGFHN
jgi:hypothetical protein